MCTIEPNQYAHSLLMGQEFGDGVGTPRETSLAEMKDLRLHLYLRRNVCMYELINECMYTRVKLNQCQAAVWGDRCLMLGLSLHARQRQRQSSRIGHA